MSAVIVVISYVFREESLEMGLVDRNDMVKQVSPAASDPPLCDSILPGAAE
jgi:hypothetical protein